MSILPKGMTRLEEQRSLALFGSAAAATTKPRQLCPTLRPHRRQPTRLRRPRDSPGKNTGVGCHFLPQCMKVKSGSAVTQSCPTLSDPMDCSLPGSSIHGIFQARVLEWGAIAFSQSYASSWKWYLSFPCNQVIQQRTAFPYKYFHPFRVPKQMA